MIESRWTSATTRVLEQDIHPDVIVLDRDITVTSVLIAQTHAPSAQVIVIWPDGVQALTGTRRVAPRLVYEQLGPAVRRSLEAAPVLVAAGSVVSTSVSSAPLEEPAAATDDAAPRFARTAARTSVMSVVLIAAVVMTMGAVFAVGGLRVKDRQAQRGGVAAQAAVIRHASTTSPTGNASQRPDLPVKTPASCDRSPKGSPNDHASGTAGAAHEERCPTLGGGIANQPDFAGQKPGHHTQAGRPRERRHLRRAQRRPARSERRPARSERRTARSERRPARTERPTRECRRRTRPDPRPVGRTGDAGPRPAGPKS